MSLGLRSARPTPRRPPGAVARTWTTSAQQRWTALLASAMGCGEEIPATFIEPVYGDTCKFIECPATATCAMDQAGVGACHCNVGYAGTTCARCEPGFHRDALDRCVSDRRCDELAEDPCGDDGECRDQDGVIECRCRAGYAGPRCQVCARGYARDAASACVPARPSSPRDGGVPGGIDAGTMDAGPRDGASLDGGGPDGLSVDSAVPEAGSFDATADSGVSCTAARVFETFDPPSGWPSQPNTCATRSELGLAGLTLRSRRGDGTVQLCAASTIHGLMSQHVELEAGPSAWAELRFAAPIEMVGFTYATRLQDLSVDVLAGDTLVEVLELPRRSSGTLSLALDPPAALVSLRSRTPYLQNVALDDIAYHTPSCE